MHTRIERDDYSDTCVVIPTLNEAATVGSVVGELKRAYRGVEVVVVDGGSDDGTATIARSSGADTVIPALPGYGNAVRAGLRFSRRPTAVMVDGDGTYDLSSLGEMVTIARSGEVAVGCRFRSKPHAMSVGRYLGNTLISLLLRTLTGIKAVDSQSGLKAFPRCLSSCFTEDGMSFSTEVLIRAKQRGMGITEVVTGDYHSRSGGSVSKLNAWRDGLIIGLFIVSESIGIRNHSAR